MNLIPVLARAFGVDPDRFEAQVEAYESPGIIAPQVDRLALVESRWRERGCPDGDFAWLLAECKRLWEIYSGRVYGAVWIPVSRP